MLHNPVSDRAEVALCCGWIMLLVAVGGTIAGKLPGRGGEIASRTQKPKQYWSGLAIYYVTGFGLIAYYLYLTGRFSN